MAKSLDLYAKRPEEMTAYLSRHGWHFSKKAFLYAVGKMYKKSNDGKEEHIKAQTFDEVEEMLRKQGVIVKNDNGYDKAYVAAMCRADYANSLSDETHISIFIKEYLDDIDGYDEKAFRHYYCDMIAMGHDIPWVELI